MPDGAVRPERLARLVALAGLLIAFGRANATASLAGSLRLAQPRESERGSTKLSARGYLWSRPERRPASRGTRRWRAPRRRSAHAQ